jgi:general secretion pathway protein G
MSIGRRPASLHRPCSCCGYTLIEAVVAVAILAVVAAVAIPKYNDYRERVRVAQAVTDIGAISVLIQQYFDDIRAFPDELDDIGWTKLDPWGNPYRYTDLASAKGKGSARKNKNLVPINSDFDVYSMGKDGKSTGPLTAKASRDDVVRANDGRFIGLASDYDP